MGYSTRYKRISHGWFRSQEASYKRALKKTGLSRTSPMTPEVQEERYRELNRKNFPSEQKFMKIWDSICSDELHRNRPLLNRFFADFIDFKRHVIFEIDGASHSGKEDYDRRRDQLLEAAGFKVVRLKTSDYAHWIEEIKKVLEIGGKHIQRTKALGNDRRRFKQRRRNKKRKELKKIKPMGPYDALLVARKASPHPIKPDLDEIMERALKARD